MFWDIFFSLLFLIVGIYALLGIFIDMNEFEWKIIRWFRRTLNFCNHPCGREYRVKEYQFTNNTEHPYVVYEMRCPSCHKFFGIYKIDVENIVDLNLLTNTNDKWHCMNFEEANVILKKGIKLK